ncbi:MAG: hypothetical protein CR981_01210 [Proteobacteria bacterium]|nr:MAG: hypothetical protein CR981_01210 [Pseudomonadota bacterium]
MNGRADLDIVLLHHPVLNKEGTLIGSAVTNLDLHDISRAARTYGVKQFFVSTPYRDQHELIGEIIGHWRHGYGSSYNPDRKEALSLIAPATSLEEVLETIEKRSNYRPFIAATSARCHQKTVSYHAIKDRLFTKKSPVLLVFGTAHGLAETVMDMADGVLPPISGGSDYNHLSVRSAVSITLDRLRGTEKV